MSFTDNLLAKLNQLAATPGKKDKLAIVQTFTDLEQDVVRLALDPTINFYMKKLPTVAQPGTEDWGPDDAELLDALATRKLTGNAALQQVEIHLRALTESAGEILRRVILRDLRCGVGVTLVNTAFPKLVPDFAYMRCSLPKASSMSKWDWSRGIYAQLKCDGMFARVAHADDGEVLITSRQGNTFPINAMVQVSNAARALFPKGTESHGELTVWINGVLQPRTLGNGILNSLREDGVLPEGAVVHFDCWDQIPLMEAVPKGKYCSTYTERFTNVMDQLKDQTASAVIQLVEYRIVQSYAEAMAYYKEVLARKLEGLILKYPDMIWRDGDSTDQVKFKLEVDVDLKIVGFNPGEPGKRTEATFGSVQCQSLDGLLDVAVSGFKRDMEEYLHNNRDSVLNKVMCVRANDVAHPSASNEKHSLFHPRFIELRDDKYEADTLQQVLDQFEAAIAG